MARDLLHARARAEDVPEADGAVVAAGDEREAGGVDGERGDAVEVGGHGVGALAWGGEVSYVEKVQKRRGESVPVMMSNIRMRLSS